jgi:hypothetical protein
MVAAEEAVSHGTVTAKENGPFFLRILVHGAFEIWNREN